ncbi:HPP family protein [Actinospica sp. MGRD01-02]|uniref:HPP family protein n=1 Tax=Actinospica acidithermotolerans TaxID=2828514 RepID=A0A941IPY9_9ACTN|nr:HPP family protein [Actinospica acidithermotolerans]MBR7830906.1 HPP family protein [Actinospica acidithermotolerans]
MRNGVRLLVLSAAVLMAVGFLGHWVGLVMLTTTLGPTAYLLLAQPENEQARVRSAVLGHGAATACGLAMLAAFGLWNARSVAVVHRESPAQILAQALAVGATLLVLTLLDAHHPPAAATALLITSGIARPGLPLFGMLAGLAALIALSAALSLATRRSTSRHDPEPKGTRPCSPDRPPGSRRSAGSASAPRSPAS